MFRAEDRLKAELLTKMKAPWLVEFHRRWHAARGKRVAASSRAFPLNWNELLEDAGVTRAEDQATAIREAEALEKSGHIVLERHRYRTYLIKRIKLPIASEPWLIELFGGTHGCPVNWKIDR